MSSLCLLSFVLVVTARTLMIFVSTCLSGYAQNCSGALASITCLDVNHYNFPLDVSPCTFATISWSSRYIFNSPCLFFFFLRLNDTIMKEKKDHTVSFVCLGWDHSLLEGGAVQRYELARRARTRSAGARCAQLPAPAAAAMVTAVRARTTVPRLEWGD